MFSYKIFGGTKQQWLIAFYGYGQSEALYSKLYEKIRTTHNILVIDNPMMAYEQDISETMLRDFVKELFLEKGIRSFQSVSYSMGSRLNLYLPLFFEGEQKKIMLIAPDGIKFNFWNRIAISTPWGRKIFKYFVDHGDVYLKTLFVFHKIGLVNKSMYAFSKWNMRDDQRRKNVYNAWMNMRLLRPNLKLVNAAIEKQGMQLISFFGKKDPVIPLAIQQRCVNFFPKQKHILLATDHNIFQEELLTLLAQEIQE